MEGRAPLEELKLQRLDWDQEWRCFLLVSAIVWFVLLLALQTPITFGILDFNIAVVSAERLQDWRANNYLLLRSLH
jgi:hypothetical protein